MTLFFTFKNILVNNLLKCFSGNKLTFLRTLYECLAAGGCTGHVGVVTTIKKKSKLFAVTYVNTNKDALPCPFPFQKVSFFLSSTQIYNLIIICMMEFTDLLIAVAGRKE